MDTQSAEPSLEVKGAAAHEHPSPAGTPPPPQPVAADNDNNAPQSDPATAGMSIKRPAPDHDDTSGPLQEAQEEDSEEARARADKKRKVLEENKAAQRKRGNRMFGVMLGTLQRAKKQVEQVEDSGAGKKRAQLQERLREKLDAERKEAIEKTEREKEMRELRAEIARREDEITAAESIVSFRAPLRRPGFPGPHSDPTDTLSLALSQYRTRHSAKLDLAGFLCTTFTLPPPPPTTDAVSVPFAPRLPHAMNLTDPRTPRPIYYLPFRLLPSQEDRIDDQIDAVKKAVRRDRDEWEKIKDDKLAEVDKLKRKKQDLVEEIERKEREERQRRRREREEGAAGGAGRGDSKQDDRASPPPPRSSRRRGSSVGGGDGGDDERMRDRSRSRSPVESRRPRSLSRSRSRSRSHSRSPPRGKAMQLDDEDDGDREGRRSANTTTTTAAKDEPEAARSTRSAREVDGRDEEASKEEPAAAKRMADDEVEY